MYTNSYYVYILTNPSNTVLYIGVTNDLLRRVTQHREKQIPGFTSKYNVTKLIYYEQSNDISEAISREKQLKEGQEKRKWHLLKQ